MKYPVAFAGEFLGGMLCGAALALPVTLLGQAIGAGQPGGWGDLIGALAGFAVAYPLGVGVGVVVIGRRIYKQIGLMWYTIFGAFGGAFLVGLLAEPTRLNNSTLGLQIAFISAPPLIAAAIFTRLTRRRSDRASPVPADRADVVHDFGGVRRGGAGRAVGGTDPSQLLDHSVADRVCCSASADRGCDLHALGGED